MLSCEEKDRYSVPLSYGVVSSLSSVKEVDETNTPERRHEVSVLPWRSSLSRRFQPPPSYERDPSSGAPYRAIVRSTSRETEPMVVARIILVLLPSLVRRSACVGAESETEGFVSCSYSPASDACIPRHPNTRDVHPSSLSPFHLRYVRERDPSCDVRCPMVSMDLPTRTSGRMRAWKDGRRRAFLLGTIERGLEMEIPHRIRKKGGTKGGALRSGWEDGGDLGWIERDWERSQGGRGSVASAC